MSFRSVPRMDIHGDRVELLQTGECVEQKHDNTSTFDSLNGSAENIGSDTLKILNNAHAKSLSQDLVGVLVVAVADVFGSHKQLNLVYLFLIQVTLLLKPPHLFNTLLFVTGELKFFFIAPKNGRSGLSLGLSQN